MERKSFFTPEFYTDPALTLDALNELVRTKQVAEMDMYESGTYLFMAVYENEDTKKILSRVISDLESYKAYNNTHYTSDEAQIGLCALVDEHETAFMKTGKEIMWDKKSGKFVHQDDFDFERN